MRAVIAEPRARLRSCARRWGAGPLPGGPSEAPIFTEILVILALVLVNGLFAGAEMAVVSLRKSRVDQLVQQGGRRAKAVKALQDDPERFLATVQVGITVVGAAAGAFGGARFARDLTPLFASVPWIGAYAEELSLVVVVSLLSFLSIVLGELVPKSLGLRYSERYALFIARPLLLLSSLMRPFVRLLTGSSNLVLRFFGDHTSFTEGRMSSQELQQVVDEATRHGGVDPAIGEIASRALDFGDLTAYHVMVPRERVVAVARDAATSEIRRILLEEGHTRMPVYEDRVENVVGYVTVRDLLALFWEKELLVLEDALRPAFFVPAGQRAVDLLSQMRMRHVQLAIVVDEAGAMIGIVTLEDLVEELVGEILDEHRHQAEPALEMQPDGSLVVLGEVPVREVNRRLDLELPDGPGHSTVGGLCIHLSGRIPSQGERFVHADATEVVVLEATPRRVLRVSIRPLRPAPETPAG